MQRRPWLILLLAMAGGPALGAEPVPRRARPAPRPRPRPAATPVPQRGAAPAIDPAPAPARAGSEPAPTPSRNAQPPIRDRVTRTGVDFGVPAPREPQQSGSFSSNDPSLERRGASTQGGLRVPAPGATVRVPF